MKTQRKWQWDETACPGADFTDPAVVDQYEKRVNRDTHRFDALVDRLNVGPGQTLIDLGAGTGAFAIRAARRCKRVYAVDVSPVMLSLAYKRAEEAGVRNIEFVRAGFLSYEHKARPVDFVTSHMALHHLPDAWKFVALTRIAAMLRPGGRFHLYDVVFDFGPNDWAEKMDGFVRFSGEKFGPEIATRAEGHVRNEYSTLSWILEGMIERAGFGIDAVESGPGPWNYFCTKLCTKKVAT
jgi:ubiquinone/menaquinone biosynthesis C-methylase UbiE